MLASSLKRIEAVGKFPFNNLVDTSFLAVWGQSNFTSTVQ